MKTFISLTFTIFLSVALFGQGDKVRYSPKLFKAINDNYERPAVKGLPPKAFTVAEREIIKLMSLHPTALSRKSKAMYQCLAEEQKISPNELRMINNFFNAYGQGKLKEANSILGTIMGVKGGSPMFQKTVAGLKTNKKQVNTQASSSSDGYDDLANGYIDLWTASGGLAGAAVGGLLGSSIGPEGTIGGAGVGVIIGGSAGRGIGSIIVGFLKIVTGNKGGEGFKLGPNGEDCQPPWIKIP